MCCTTWYYSISFSIPPFPAFEDSCHIKCQQSCLCLLTGKHSIRYANDVALLSVYSQPTISVSNICVNRLEFTCEHNVTLDMMIKRGFDVFQLYKVLVFCIQIQSYFEPVTDIHRNRMRKLYDCTRKCSFISLSLFNSRLISNVLPHNRQ